jgi:uncharacterized protein
MKNKIVVVTGSSKGLGKALVDGFTSRGATCIGVSRSEGKDVRNLNDLNKVKEEVLQKHGRIDIWINNAGVWSNNSFEEMSPEEIENVIKVNTLGTIYGCKAILPSMKKRKDGIIVNIVSTSGIKAKKGQEVYCASKFAIKGFTDGLRINAQEYNVRVIGIYPGGMKTDLFSGEVEMENFMDPKDVAKMIVDVLDCSSNMLPELIIRRM